MDRPVVEKWKPLRCSFVCGEALWDLFGVETSSGLRFDARMGGSPFNVAVGLARLCQPVALFTGLSTDGLGRRLHDTLETEGVRDRADRPQPQGDDIVRC